MPGRVQRVLGELCPNRLYTREGCMRFAGIGNDSLAQARQSGMVKPLECGRRLYYRGSELIAWIEHQHAANVKNAERTAQVGH